MPIYKQGDYVEITSLYTIDSYLGLEVGDIYVIEEDRPEQGGVLFKPPLTMARSMDHMGLDEEDGLYVLLYGQIQLVDPMFGEMFRKN